MTDDLHALRFPVGEWTWPESVTPAEVTEWIEEIAALPGRVRAAVEPLSAAQLDTPYRPDGWTVRQVVHHLGDSHINSVVRFKLALTEDRPVIRPYDEAAWARLHDYRDVPVPLALDFLDTLHARWVVLLRGLDPAQLDRLFHHPEWPRPIAVGANIAQYAWHGRHHLAHITRLAEREGW